MTEDRELPAITKVREEFREGLMQAARTSQKARPSLRRKLAVPVAALALIGGATGIAVAGDVIGGDETREVQKVEAQKVRAPLFGAIGPYPECPVEVGESLLKLNDLSEYARTPGYPVAGCPTLKELEEVPGVSAEIAAMAEQRRRAEE